MLLKNKYDITKENKDYQIKAVAADTIEDVIKKDKPDCILLGPQIQYMLSNIKPFAEENNIPLEVINMQDYGMMNGPAVLKQAESLMQ
ncbi:hypothetical protein GCM10022297_17420 [Lactobacillus hamsteri]|uniref:PTS EIIB type-3 domain-containing protein n=1 Tax=Lactobacillus hamsteri DSM 5661 = JCM 6256 TaxID=1423754 RepID=A0A0R1Y6F7_9LACO|nr:hypothetical protein [Lactobacillus hamsteri]KRM37645.1 hypothetical protein FC39_GL000104 [Lactobacillus hamsteri DSM 5661 = JCM 6256]